MKPILVLSVLLQLTLIPQPEIIADGRKTLEIVEYADIKPLEPLSLDFKPIPVKPVYVTPKGDWVAQCHGWAAQAGIKLPPAAISVIDGESDCSPAAQNPRSTAYGIGQFLNSTWGGVGCRKTSDPVEQLRCMKKYVDARYGGWGGAWQYWLKHHSY